MPTIRITVHHLNTDNRPPSGYPFREISGDLLALFILFVILYMVGIDQWICIGFGGASSSVLVWQTFALNARYGEHGLMKLGAAKNHPRYLINRRRITRLFKRQKKEETT